MSAPANPPGGRPVAFVTGASRGIGKAAAVDLAAAGFDVAISARTLTDGEGRADTEPGLVVAGGLDTTAAAIEACGGTALAMRMDLLDRPSVMACVEATYERFGRIDVVVNNGIYQGAGTMDRIVELTEENLRKLFEGNVFAQLAIVQAVLGRMIAQGGGTIVNLVSGSAVNDPPAKVGEGGWGMGYAMSKAAFGRLTPLLHVEHRDDGIRVFSVDPGFTVTEKMIASGRAAQYAANFAVGTPEVIGRAIRWLVTDPEADQFRGQTVYAQSLVKKRSLLPGWPPPREAGAAGAEAGGR